MRGRVSVGLLFQPGRVGRRRLTIGHLPGIMWYEDPILLRDLEYCLVLTSAYVQSVNFEGLDVN